MPEEADVHGMALSHLQMIEHAYSVGITNKEEICGSIIKATNNPREILTIALALNNWVAVQMPGKELVIPLPVVEQIIAGTVGRW